MSESYGPLIHAALLERVCETCFAQIIYEDAGSRMVLGPPVTQKGARTRRGDQATWADSPRNKLPGVKLERRTWPWEFRLSFPVEVDLEAFEESMAANPPLVPRELPDRPFQIRLMLDTLEMRTPVEQSPGSGMTATYRILATSTPR